VEAICDRVGIIKEGRLIVVEDIHSFKRKTGKVMNITFKVPVSPEQFSGIPGIANVERAGPNGLTITVSSNVDGVVKELAKHHVEDLDYQELSLETMFLKYYEKEQTVDRTGRVVKGKGVGR
jgi:ABC-2 type transport system ATP-binding protein